MSRQGFQETLISSQVDGTALTAAAAASCLPGAAKFVLPANYFEIGRQLRITASGRISCAVTTPGTGRFDVRFGSVVVFDSLAFNLNVVAKTSVGWWLEILLTCRAIGASTSANLMGQGKFTSEANVGAPVPGTGGSTTQILPISTAPAVGTGFDSTASQAIDLYWTQTVATGSLTLHQYLVESLN
jgi:hypothetical protein